MQSFSDFVSGRSWPLPDNDDCGGGSITSAQQQATSSSTSQVPPTSSSSLSSFAFWPFAVSSQHEDENDKQQSGEGSSEDGSSQSLLDEDSRQSNSPIFVGEGHDRFAPDLNGLRIGMEGRNSGIKLKTPRLVPRQGSSRKSIKKPNINISNDEVLQPRQSEIQKPPSPPSPERSNRSNSTSGPLVDWLFDDSSFMSFAAMNDNESKQQPRTSPDSKSTSFSSSATTTSLSDIGSRLSVDIRMNSGLDPRSKKFLQLMHAHHIASINDTYCPQLVTEYNMEESIGCSYQEEEKSGIWDGCDSSSELNGFDLFAVADLRTAAHDDVTTLLPYSPKLQIIKGPTQQSSISDKNVLSTYASNAMVPSATSLTNPLPSAILTSVTSKIHHDMHNTFVATPQQLMNDVQKQWTDAAWSMMGVLGSFDSPADEEVADPIIRGRRCRETIYEPSPFCSTTTCDVSEVLPSHVLVNLNAVCTCKGAHHTQGTQEEIAGQASQHFEKLVICEETVPDIFLDPDFDMATPKTFEAVMEVLQSIQSTGRANEDSEEERSVDKRKKKKPLIDRSLLEKSNAPLNLYWDVAEDALREQVSKRSKAYFSENSKFRDLEVDTALLMRDVNSLKAEFASMQECAVRDPLSVPLMAIERDHVQSLSSVIDKISDFFIEKDKIRHLLQSKQNQSALDMISSLRDTMGMYPMCKNDGTNMPMSKLNALDQLREDISSYETEAIENITSEIVDFLLPGCKISVGARSGVSIPKRATEEGMGSAQSRVYSDEKILRQLKILQGTDSLSLLTERYSTRLKESLNGTVDTVVTQFASDFLDDKLVENAKVMVQNGKHDPRVLQGGSDKSSPSKSIVNNNGNVIAFVEAMSFGDFLKCLQLLFPAIMELLSASTEVYDLLAKGNFDESTETTKSSLPNDDSNSSCLREAVDWSQKILANLVDMRDKESLSLLSVDDMKRFYTITSSHAVQIGKLIGSPPSTFLSSVSAKVRSYFDVRHVRQVAQLEKSLDDEKWVVATMTAESREQMRLFAPQQDDKCISDPNAEQDTADRSDLVESALFLLECIQWNIECTRSFPEFSRSLVKKAAETLHKFHQRSSKIIFDLEIVNSTGQLLSIDISQLSVALDTISFILEALPNIRLLLVHQASTEQSEASQQVLSVAEAKFDKLSREYEMRVEKILNHVCASVKRMLQFSSTILLKNVDFDRRAEDFAPLEAEEGGLEVCQFFQYAFSNIASVHKAAYGTIPNVLFTRLLRQLYEHIDQELPVFLVMAASSHSSPSVVSRRLSFEHENSRRHTASTLKMQEATHQEEDTNANEEQSFALPITKEGKRRMLVELMWLTTKLNQLDGVEPHPFTLATVLGRKLGIIKRSSRKVGASGRMKTKTKKSKGTRSDSVSLDSDSETISTTTSMDSFARGVFSDIPIPDSLEPGSSSISISHDSVSDAASIASSSSGLCFNGEEELF